MHPIDSPVAAFIAGLVTSIHCAGMCGPLACMLVHAGNVESGRTRNDADGHLAATAYHVARVAGYATLGALGGALGRAPLSWFSQSAARWIPWGLVVIFIGIAFRWDRYLPRVPGTAGMAWKLQGWARRRSRVGAAAAIGAGTPLLPCGPLYFVLAFSVLSGSALRGTEFMLAFGLGTIPLLWVAQAQFGRLGRVLSPIWLNRTRVSLALVTAGLLAWRLRGTLGFAGPGPGALPCH